MHLHLNIHCIRTIYVSIEIRIKIFYFKNRNIRLNISDLEKDRSYDNQIP